LLIVLLQTVTTASTTISSATIKSTRPATITTTIDLTGPTPVTTTTITTTGVTMITTNTTPFITIDSDTEEEGTTKPGSKHQKTNHPGDTGDKSSRGYQNGLTNLVVLCRNPKYIYVCIVIYIFIHTRIRFRTTN
jgi:hypothetical protein